MNIKWLILLTVVATTVYYLWQNPVQREQIIGKVHQVAPELNRTTLYKWKDKNGHWQITDKPPAKGIQYETVSTADQQNVMPGKPKQN